MANDSMCSWCKTVIKAGEPMFTDTEKCDYHKGCMPAVIDFLGCNGEDALSKVIDGPLVGVRGRARIVRKK